jgi:PPOX class probable F420-dependent enzyme
VTVTDASSRTVTDRGAPAPNPVWFVPDGDDLVIFSTPDARKVHSVEQRPTVTLHFNSDPDGGDVVVITGEAAIARGQRPSALSAYLDKYESSITGPLGMTVDEIDRSYNTEVRIRPEASLPRSVRTAGGPPGRVRTCPGFPVRAAPSRRPAGPAR